ncbi:MAG: hypothetical protein J3K34DRAFT_383530 [Monoraphidium minutum]|nr:MAG: hypothetical protein J3K34DRAFT_383530 [Monoraphidium minutum]
MPDDKPSAVAKVSQLLHRRFRVVLADDRVVVGDFQCLDKQGNLILGNAAEIIQHHAPARPPASGGPANGGGGGAAGAAAGGAPHEKVLGTILVPKARQKDVQLQVTLSEKAAMLQLAGS